MSVQQFARLIAVFSSLLAALAAFGQVTASAPYTVSTFAAGVSGVYFQPDSIALLNSHITAVRLKSEQNQLVGVRE